ncbi:hypothetical protein BDP55DRAFT_265128 [Colletotrichum godetiae]|uniref:Uncharacterized protein n=1 Tax=Colletotrichum godetiae TaxID=1209918 RepID=A0AAJ0AW28_9PEZI|nr:uncharacterized protein BDP55DRAFT_265128 [Colletotrichum godetiae]KAK1691446.1 hypothetical protein BDP55DRAFT_265128 [Colletotrichum godetiae]
MESDDEEVQTGRQTPKEGLINENVQSSSDNAVNAVDTEYHSSENENTYENHGHSENAAEMHTVNVQCENDKDRRSLDNVVEAKTQKPCNCHTPTETAAKSVTGQKHKKDTVEDTAETKKSEEADGTQGTGKIHNGNIQHGRSLQQSRAALRSLPFHQGFVEVRANNDGSDSDDQHDTRPQRVDNLSSWAKSVVSETMPEDVDDRSQSRLEWLRQKREDGEENPYLDQVMSMVGLENVKAHFLAVKARVRESQVDDPCLTRFRLAKLRLHLVLYGKDGTGKPPCREGENVPLTILYRQEIHSLTLRTVSLFYRSCTWAEIFRDTQSQENHITQPPDSCFLGRECTG